MQGIAVIAAATAKKTAALRKAVVARFSYIGLNMVFFPSKQSVE
jgi:hypothetical protein